MIRSLAIWALELFKPFVLVLIGTRGSFWTILLLLRIDISVLLFLSSLLPLCLCILGLPNQERLIFGGFEGSHRYQLILFLNKRFYDNIKGWNSPIWSWQSLEVKGGYKHWELWSKFAQNIEHQLLILFVNSTLLALHDQGFEFGEELLDGFKVARMKRNQLSLQNMAS